MVLQMNDLPLVSVIVPVYKVEAYLPQCLDSLSKQSYRNLEFILVDDGSPDRCGLICDRYAGNDSRFRAVHQANAGLSSARNTGIAHARGKYLGFVDGDDWVEPDMFNALVREAERKSADVVMCQFNYALPDGRVVTPSGQEFTVQGTEALHRLVTHDGVDDYVCNKLFHAKLFDTVRFPPGRNFEDIGSTYKLLSGASWVVSLPEAYYWYRQRDDGIVRSGTLSNELDCYRAKWERYEALRGELPQDEAEMKADLGHSAVKIWAAAWNSRRELAQYRGELMSISAFVKENYSVIRPGLELGPTGRATLFLTRFTEPWAFRCSYQLRRLYQYKHKNYIGGKSRYE